MKTKLEKNSSFNYEVETRNGKDKQKRTNSNQFNRSHTEAQIFKGIHNKRYTKK